MKPTEFAFQIVKLICSYYVLLFKVNTFSLILVVLVVVLVVLGVVLEQVEAVAKPLLVPVLKKPPPGPPKPPPNLVRVENPTRTISGGGL